MASCRPSALGPATDHLRADDELQQVPQFENVRAKHIGERRQPAVADAVNAPLQHATFARCDAVHCPLGRAAAAPFDDEIGRSDGMPSSSME